MGWLNTIGRKITAAFLVVGVLTAGLGVFALSRLSLANAEVVALQTRAVPAVQAVAEIRAQMGEYRTFELAQLERFEDPKARDDYRVRMQKIRMGVAHEQKVLQHVLGANEQQLLQTVNSSLETYLASSGRIDQALDSGNIARAQDISSNAARPQRRELFDALEQLNAQENAVLAAHAQQSQSTFVRNVWLIATALAVILVVSLVWSVVIGRALTRPLVQAVNSANAIAQGNFDTTLESTRSDEVGQLLAAMAVMQRNIEAVLAEQNNMAAQHTNGFSSYRIDPSAYNGGYKNLVLASNALVDNHIGVKMNMVKVLTCYAQGDFSARMVQLPNEQGTITRIMEQTRSQLMAISADIQCLVEAACAGNFAARGNSGRYTHEFKTMVDGLNTLMATTEDNLQRMGGVLERISQGDLTATMDGDSAGVFAAMQATTNRTVNQLTRMVGAIQHSAQHIGAASGEIAAGNRELSARTEVQAANLEETAASMEELTATVKHNAENALLVCNAAQHATSAVAQGAQAVDQVVEVMATIDRSAGKMRDIIGVIDTLAFQSNLLALNAAVEAARAGDSGKGFAVVASEIRALAQSSAHSAKDIRALIDSTSAAVSVGVEHARNAGAVISDVRGAVHGMHEKVQHIAQASREQATGIELVNASVVGIDHTTQQNAAMVEEASAAAQALDSYADDLLRSVEVFRTHPVRA